jgi:translation initiation factor 1
MGKRKKKTEHPPQQVVKTSLGSLLAERGFAPSTPTPTVAEPSPQGSLDLSQQKRLNLSMERKGRGGKTVTVLTRLEADDDGRAQLAKDLRRALGCGARVEGTDIVLQGDVRDRARSWLLERGVARITGQF